MENVPLVLTIEASASATHPPGTVVHPDGSLTPPSVEEITAHELDDDEGDDRL
jgi:hypothetical protein